MGNLAGKFFVLKRIAGKNFYMKKVLLSFSLWAVTVLFAQKSDYPHPNGEFHWGKIYG